MFRSTSTIRGSSKYEKLEKGYDGNETWNEELKRSTSLPSTAQGSAFEGIKLHRNLTKKGNDNKKEKIHPLFNLLDFHRKKKTMAKPELSRYLDYLKEGGIWDSDSNKPVIYYK
ncbi:hypothetical protein TanjilG_22820 [Lupinus angustifolius]|uniref:Uncharacterized protein n=1 Tax=Lupinus angustifolius TaxID=3871 RepID=A0A4P1RHN6_LUPAN|nr:PREDICTED: uncharacterized protein LOC109350970 [Lupinus angustifolius]OIW11013.1 hypothetical protein TanjilG_22820 [Lupinus angustifolius]